MGDPGVYTALSGAIAQSAHLDVISHNIANVNTPAFKKEELLFQEQLALPPKGQHKVMFRMPSFAESQGSVNSSFGTSYVGTPSAHIRFQQGPLLSTQRPLDVALDGQGFFEVLTPQGVQWTRHGGFRLNNQGQLITRQGHFVLQKPQLVSDQAIAESPKEEERVIALKGIDIRVSPQGDILENGQKVATLSVVLPPGLKKVESTLYTSSLKSTLQKPMPQASGYVVHQGHLEGSNVNIVKEMTDMISATRLFESTQKAISAFDQINGQLIQQVPQIR